MVAERGWLGLSKPESTKDRLPSWYIPLCSGGPMLRFSRVLEPACGCDTLWGGHDADRLEPIRGLQYSGVFPSPPLIQGTVTRLFCIINFILSLYPPRWGVIVPGWYPSGAYVGRDGDGCDGRTSSRIRSSWIVFSRLVRFRGFLAFW